MVIAPGPATCYDDGMKLLSRLRALPDARRNWLLFMMATVFLGFTTGLYETTFNNYLSDVYHVSAQTRGLFEFPRELPGCSIVVISAILAFLPEVKVAVIAVLAWAIGLAGLGMLSPGLFTLLFWMVIWSAGSHLYMVMNQSIGVSVAEDNRVGSRLGQLAGASTAAIVVGAAVVWLGTKYLGLAYTHIYVLAAISTFLGALLLIPMKIKHPGGNGPSVRFVVRRRYGLFYALSVLFGARKQVFMTFGPWVIIRVFHQPASTIAMLWIVASLLGVVFKPFLGRLVDTWGERKVLMGEALALVLVCLGYASGENLGFGRLNIGLYLTYACFVADQLLMVVGIARTTYLKKMAENPRDLTPTLSFGISIDHAVSTMIPTLGGIIWAESGYQSVFLAAAVIALINLAVAGMIRLPAGKTPANPHPLAPSPATPGEGEGRFL